MLRTTPRVLAFNKRRNRILQWMLMICAWLTLFMAAQFQGVTASLPNGGDYSSSKATTSPSLFIRIPGNRYELLESDWSQDDRGYWMGGSGREYMLFDSRGGSSRKKHQDDDSDADDDDDTTKDRRAKELLTRFRRSRLASSPTTTSRNRFRWSTGGGLYGNRASPFDNGNSSSNNRIEFLDTVQTWWSANVIPTLEKMPKIVCRVEPTTTLKLRKTFRPLKTIIRLGADFNTQLGVWQFQSSWEDAIIGGKLTLAGKELQLTKSWQLSVGAVEDLVTRLRFRAAINLQTFQAYARVGFRTERLSPINIMEGFTIVKRLPLDGSRGNVKLEVKANVALPEPELEYNTETQGSLIGNMGDVEVSIDELNLLLEY